MLRGSLLILCLSLTGLACGGGSEAAPAVQQVSKAPAPAPPSDEQRLRVAQEQGCAGYCDRVTECAVDSAKQSMSEEELADLNLAETAPALRNECSSECLGSELSVRQVEVMHGCLREKITDCDEFVACMEAMTPATSS